MVPIGIFCCFNAFVVAFVLGVLPTICFVILSYVGYLALVLETLSDTGLEAPLPSLFSDAGGGLARRRRHCSSSHVILFNAPLSVVLF